MSCMKRGGRKARRIKRNAVVPIQYEKKDDDGNNHVSFEDESILTERKKRISRRVPGKTKKHESVDKSFMDEFLRESMHCGNCLGIFSLSSNELKIHCNICNEFFHCGIAGECIGDDCLIKNDEGGYKHRARYCNKCVSKIFNNETCLCKNCDSK